MAIPRSGSARSRNIAPGASTTTAAWARSPSSGAASPGTRRTSCTCSPVGVDVTLLSVADRLATQGDNAELAIGKHLDIARPMLTEALRWEAEPPRPPVRGDELIAALGIAPGPEVGGLLAELQAEAFSGELATPEQAIDRARQLVAARDS